LPAPATSCTYICSLHDALPIYGPQGALDAQAGGIHPVLAAPEPVEHRLHAGPDAELGHDRDDLGVGQLDVLPAVAARTHRLDAEDRKSTRLNSSHVKTSYAVCC